MATFTLREGVVLHGVHELADCIGRHCVIHNPSEHRLSGAPLNWRSDTQVMERICPHGIGHPDPDHIAYVRSLTPEHDCEGSPKLWGDSPCPYPHLDWQGVHGCDGCC